MLDLDCPQGQGSVVYRARGVSEVNELGDRVVLMVPFEAVDKVYGEEGYAPGAMAGVTRGIPVTIRLYGDETVRLSVEYSRDALIENSPMLQMREGLNPCPAKVRVTGNGWEILDTRQRVRARIDHSIPEATPWNERAGEMLSDLDLTLFPDGETPAPLKRFDRFFGSLFGGLPLCFVEKDGKVLKSSLAMAAKAGECFCGTGERFAKMDLSGRTLVLENTDALGVNSPRAYKNVPFYLCSRPYGLFIHTSNHARLSLAGVSTMAAQVVVEEGALDVFIIGGGSPERILFNYRSLTGFPPDLPLWSYGMWMSRMTYFSEEEVRTVARRLREEDFPCDVIHLDTGWFEKEWVCDWKFSSERFPDPARFMREMKGQGFRITLWQKPDIGKGNRLLEEAEKRGYLGKRREDASVTGSDLSQQRVGGHIDFSNPEAVSWYQGMLRELLEAGAAVIKTDFGEEISNADYRIPQERLHNLYGLLYQGAAFAVTKETTGDGIVWARSGWAGSQRYPVHWGGDAESSFDGMAGSLRGGLHLGLSGFAYWSHDVPGFHSFTHARPLSDLYVRWTQFGVFSSHLRYHGCGAREPYEYPDVADIVRKWLRLRYALIPYIVEQARKSVASGMPVLRALLLHHPRDPVAWRIDDQYYFGDDFLVSPVMNASGVRDIYLPEGVWVSFWSGARLAGPQWLRGVWFDLDKLGLFVREGARIPLYPEPVSHTGEMDLSRSVILEIDGSFHGCASVEALRFLS